MCLYKHIGGRQDIGEAVRYFKSAADKGDPCAQVCYGLCCYDGTGISKDWTEAVRYFRMASDQGDKDGQWNYGLCLAKGEGIEKNTEEGHRLILMSGRVDGEIDVDFLSLARPNEIGPDFLRMRRVLEVFQWPEKRRL